MRTPLVFFLLLGYVSTATAQPSPTVSDEPLSDRRVSYDLAVTLDPEARTVTGLERVTWRNPDRVPVDELQFHLYLNAFSGPNSTFMRESGGGHRGFRAEGTDPWGSLEITRMQQVDATPPPYGDLTLLPDLNPQADTEGIDLTEALTFIRPDDGNIDDRTVVSIRLPRPVQPGETITLDVAFAAKLPRIFARTGWAETDDGRPFFMVAQWFPKLGVYEIPGQRYVPETAPHGAWSTHQFHANSEFYADFGTYRVQMNVPEGYRVGATGVRLNEDTADGRQTFTYWAEDVHDFAWTASPAFQVYTDTWRHVQLRLLLQPAHVAQAQRHFDAAKTALRYFDRWYGEYPYTTLTLVDGIGGSNGMEYPTLITCGTYYRLPEWLRALELVTIHEFGHQYWYGMVASNEAEEAWLDEGINSYTEVRIMDEAYGPGSVIDLPGFRVSDAHLQRTLYTENVPERGAVFEKSWEQRRGDYGKLNYAKPATVLLTLEQYLGSETMQRVMRTYFERWRFRHPTTRDFITVAEDVAGEPLDWFFDAFIYGTDVVDYAVDSLRHEASEAGYEARVLVRRLEAGVLPQTLRVRFEDGTTEARSWDGASERKTFTFAHSTPVVEAYLDPDNRARLDVNPLNNRKTLQPDPTVAAKYGAAFMVWVQLFFSLISGLM